MRFGVLEEDFTLEPLALSLQAVPGWKGNLRIFQRAESSFSVGREGPHLDLLNWKHCHSDWVELKRTKPLQFAVAAIPTPRFPSYTPQELEAAVLSELK